MTKVICQPLGLTKGKIGDLIYREYRLYGYDSIELCNVKKPFFILEKLYLIILLFAVEPRG